MHLKYDAFAIINGPRFLKFYDDKDEMIFPFKMHLPPSGLEYLSSKLRYLHWFRFPSKSFPPSFRADLLVELDPRGSKLVKLWTGVKV
jgi:hypothetical protein